MLLASADNIAAQPQCKESLCCEFATSQRSSALGLGQTLLKAGQQVFELVAPTAGSTPGESGVQWTGGAAAELGSCS